MRKFVLTTAYLGLVTLPVASLVACTLRHQPNETSNNADYKRISSKKSHLTRLSEVETLNFKKGELYSPTEMGLENVFSESDRFEVKFCDDLAGKILVVQHRKNSKGKTQSLKNELTVAGFRKTAPKEFFERLRTSLPSQDKLASSLKDKLEASFFESVDDLKTSDLGIDHYFDFRQAEHTVKTLNYDQLAGELAIIVNIKLGGEKFDLPIKVVGLKSDVDPEVSARLNTVLEVLEKIENSETSHSDKLASVVSQRIGDINFWDQLGIGEFPKFKTASEEFKVSFEKGAHTSDKTGTIELKVTLSFQFKGQTFQRSKTILVYGFLTSQVAKDKKDQILVQNIKNYLEKSFYKTTELTDVLASEAKKVYVNGLGNLKELGLDDLPRSLVQDAEIVFTAQTANDSKGTLSLLVEIRAGKANLKTSLLIEGYKTSAQEKKEKQRDTVNDVDKLLGWIQDNYALTNLSDKFPSDFEKSDQELTFEKLGFYPVPVSYKRDIAIKLKIVKTDDDLGVVELRVSASKDNYSRDLMIKLSGFKTNLTSLRELFDWVSSNLKPTKFSDRIPSEVKQENETASFEELGLDKIPTQQKNGVNVDLLVSKTNDTIGTMEVTLMLTRGKAKLIRELTIYGFKKTADPKIVADLEAVYRLIKLRLDNAKLSDYLPSDIARMDQELSLVDFDIPKLDKHQKKGVNYKIEVKGLDDEKGTLTLKIKVDKWGYSLEKDYVLSGLMTIEQHDQKLVKEKVKLIKRLNKIGSSDNYATLEIDHTSQFFGQDPSQITDEDVANNWREFSIRLPKFLDGVELEWTIEKHLTTQNSLVINLVVSSGQVSEILTFKIIGFEKLGRKVIDDIVKRIPSNVSTIFGKKRVIDFKPGSNYSFDQLGIEVFDSRLDQIDTSLTVWKIDDAKGTIVIVLTLVSDNYKQTKKIVVDNYWNDSKRLVAQREIPGKIDKVFDNFHHDQTITGLSEKETNGLLTYDQTYNASYFIGDSYSYAPGQKLTLEKLRLIAKGRELRKTVEQIDPDYNIFFEIVERPSSVDFHGVIRIRPTVRFIDQEISAKHTILIGGFQNFENYFARQVEIWSKKIPNDMPTNSQGTYLSLIAETNAWNSVTNRTEDQKITKVFMEATGLSKKFQGMNFGGKYSLEVKAILIDHNILEPGNFYNYQGEIPTEYTFEFVVGLKGEQWENFNQKIYASEGQSLRVNYEQNYHGKRSFTKVITGFDSQENIVQAFEKWINDQQQISPFVPGTNLSKEIENTHFRGILAQVYKKELLPEFHADFIYSKNYSHKRWLLRKILTNLKNGKSVNEVSVDYSNQEEVRKWWEKTNWANKYVNWRKMPIEWEQQFSKSLRPLVDSAEPYFQFVNVDNQYSENPVMNFRVALRYRNISAFKGRLPELWSQHARVHYNLENEESSRLKILDVKFKLQLSRSLENYMHDILELDNLKTYLFTEKTSQNLRLKSLESTPESHKIEVKLPVFETTHDDGRTKSFEEEPTWETNLRAKQWLFDEQANKTTEFVWPKITEKGRDGLDTLKGHSLSNAFVSRRYKRLKYDFKVFELDFEKHLSDLGITIILEKLSTSGFDHNVEYHRPKYNATTKFRPWLIYNNPVWVKDKESETVMFVNGGVKPILVKGKAIWEVNYKLIPR